MNLRNEAMLMLNGLIRAHNLGNSFAAKLDRAVRKEFKELVASVRQG